MFGSGPVFAGSRCLCAFGALGGVGKRFQGSRVLKEVNFLRVRLRWGSGRLVTRYRRLLSPRLLLESPVGGACSGEQLL